MPKTSKELRNLRVESISGLGEIVVPEIRVTENEK